MVYCKIELIKEIIERREGLLKHDKKHTQLYKKKNNTERTQKAIRGLCHFAMFKQQENTLS